MATGRIGTTPVLRTRWSKEPAGGTTSLSGLDDNSVSLVYEVGYEAVYQNGALLSRGNDYTATDGTTITLTNATVAGDIIEVFANNVVPLTDTYSQSVADGKFVNNTIVDAKGDLIVGSAADTFTRLAVGSANQVLTVDSATTSGLKWAAPAAPSFVGCSLTKSANQSVNDATYTAITFNTESFDTDGFHSTVTNTERITIPSGKGGKYLFVATADIAANATGIRQAGFWKNGSIQKGQVALSAASAGETKLTVSAIYDLVATDYIEFYVYQNSTAARNVLSDGTIFSCQYLGA